MKILNYLILLTLVLTTVKSTELTAKTSREHFFWLGVDQPMEVIASLDDEEEIRQIVEKGKKIVEKEATEGKPEAQKLLADYYYSFTNEPKKGIEWAQKGAETGDACCMAILRNAYKYGRGVKQSLENEWLWTFLAAKAGDRYSQKAIEKALNKNPNDIFYKRAYLRANEWIDNHPLIKI